ncbi:MAG: hypothetical protein WBD83_01090, partial [Xanthobacteraceae bacterium]
LASSAVGGGAGALDQYEHSVVRCWRKANVVLPQKLLGDRFESRRPGGQFSREVHVTFRSAKGRKVSGRGSFGSHAKFWRYFKYTPKADMRWLRLAP